ncbi:MAG: hypothetical protein JWM80_647 [Cyanobacteria bacterium RYN_339]|nr:hypothetical protein [Cyanobacteria bacterium RYN_339]
MLGGFARVAENAALKAEIKPIKPHEAAHEVAQIRADMKEAKTPSDLHAATRRAQELHGRMEASPNQHFPEHLQHEAVALRDRTEKANAAVGQLHSISNTLQHGTATERATMTAHLLSHPSEFRQTLKDISGPLAGSPLLQHQENRAARIAGKATPEHLGLELAHDPDLSHYPPGIAEDLGALRVIPDAKLQQGLDAVGQDLLAKSQTSRDAANAPGGFFGNFAATAAAGPDPLSLANVEKSPGLGQLIAPLQNSSDPAVSGQVKAVAQAWNESALMKNLDANKHGEPTDPKTNATNSYQGFQQEMSDLAMKTGMGTPIMGAMDDATKGVASKLLDRSDVDLKAVQENPAYGQVIAQVQNDPAFQDRVDAKVKDLVVQDVKDRMDGKKKEDGVKDGMEEIKGDLQGLAETTGLGEAISRNAEAAIGDGDAKKAIHDAGERGKNILDHLSDGFNSLVGDFAKGISFTFKAVGEVNGAVFDAVGLHGVADAERQFNAGIGDGLAGTVTGLGQMVTHPLASAKGIGGMITHPERLAEAGKMMWDEAMKGGLAHGLGYGLAMIAPAILTDGGSLGGSVAGMAAKGTAELVARDIPVISNFAGKLGNVGSLGVRSLAVLKGGFAGDIGKVVDGISAGSSKEALKAAGLGKNSLKDVAKDGASQIRAGAEALKNVAKADDKSAAIKELASNKTRDIRRSYLKGKQDQIRGLKAVRHPKQGAAEFKRALSTSQSKLRAARDAIKYGQNVTGGKSSKLSARAGVAIDQLGKGLETITNTGFFKAGEAAVGQVGTLVNPLGAITKHMPGAALEDQIDKRAKKVVKKLDATSQASISPLQADEDDRRREITETKYADL